MWLNKYFYPLAILLVFNCADAKAFLSSGEFKKKQEAAIGAIKIDFEKSDCLRVIDSVNKFLKNKPPSHLKKQAYIYLGSCYEKTNAIDKALITYELANALYPENKFFLESLANIYIGAGFFEKSLSLFKELVKNGDCSYKTRAGLAKSYDALGFYEKARKNFSEALEMSDYKDFDLIKKCADSLIKVRHYDEALKIFESADGFKKDAESELIFARIFMYKKEYIKASSHIAKARALAPERRDIALYDLFLSVLAADYEKVLIKVKYFTEKNSGDSLPLYAKAIVDLKKGNKKAAREILGGISNDKKSFHSQIAAVMLKEMRSKRQEARGKIY